MTTRSRSVRNLATATGLELDEVLVTLWLSGLEYLSGPESRIRERDIKSAQSILGLPTKRETQSPEHWMAILGIDESEMRALLASLGLAFSSRAKKLPDGAVSLLRAESRKRRTDVAAQVLATKARQEPESEAAELGPSPPHIWRTPGHERPIIQVTEAQVRAIHWALVKDFGRTQDPIDPPGVRSEHLLASAVFRQHTSIGGMSKYSTVETTAAALLHALILNHPFHNGNKRTALVSMLVLLDENNFFPTCHEDELFKLVLKIAKHQVVQGDRGANQLDRETLAIADWICAHTRLSEHGDRVIPWRKLRRILTAYGCTLEIASGVGNRINITKFHEEKGPLGIKKTRQLRTQVYYHSEGRDAAVDTVSVIRADLYLDDLHGVDSRAFYKKEPTRASDYIAKYRKTLRRLASL